MKLNLADLKNLDYALSVALKTIKKHNKFDEYDVNTTELQELQCRVQEEILVIEEDDN
jgi:hypothetical protein